MTSFATKKYTTTTEESMFSKTDAEYAEMDKATADYREIAKTLKALEALGMYGTERWNRTFSKYAESFKKANGYRPHWAR